MNYVFEEYQAPREERHIVRPELNLAKWPQIFATRQTKGRSRVIERGDSKVIIGQQIDNKGNEIEVGFLIVPDSLVLLGLIELWEINDRPEEKRVTGRVRGFLEHILKGHPGGSGYRDLERSLKRLVHIPLNWVNSFHDSRTGKLESINDYTFRFLQELKITKMRRGEKLELSTFSFKFNDHFLENLLNGFTKPLNLGEMVKFKREISVLAYMFLDLVMAQRTRWERKSNAFIRDDLHIESVRYNRPAHRKNELEKVLQELRGCKLSTGIIKSAYLRKTNDGTDYKLVIEKRSFQEVPFIRIATRPAKDRAELNELVEKMIVTLGRQRNRAFYHLLALKCPRDLINTALRDTIDAYNAGQINTSKAAYFGWLIKDIAKDRGIDLGLKSSSIIKKDGAV